MRGSNRPDEGRTLMAHQGGRGVPLRRARLADVAKRAGVSVQTVSNVVNERSGCTEATRQRVLTAMEELGYQPNATARNLRLRRTMRLGYYLSEEELDFRNPIGITFLRELVVVAAQHGYEVLVFASRGDDPAAFHDTVAKRTVDGFVLSHSSVTDALPRKLTELGMPFAAMGRTARDLPQTWVDIDNFTSIGPLIDYLVEQGHRRFGYVGEAGNRYWIAERLDGVRARLAHHGLSLADSAVVAGAPEHIGPALRRMFSRKSRPSVLVGGTDRAAAAAYEAATSMGLAVGTDIALTTIDIGGPVPWHIPIPLTAMRIPIAEIIDALVARVAREIEHGPTGEPGAVVATTVVTGLSA
jgi:DNA-binding LacI/PurR family transcriptional regulator